jgi:hypothetical protein
MRPGRAAASSSRTPHRVELTEERAFFRISEGVECGFLRRTKR